jgi:hypothetical protein
LPPMSNGVKSKSKGRKNQCSSRSLLLLLP